MTGITTNPDTLIATFGLLGVLAVVFVETGLLVGFFLPGDSLLFTAGVLAAQVHPAVPIWLLVLSVPAASIAGDQCGYLLGAKAGPAVLETRAARRLGHRQVERAQRYFAVHGKATVFLARFVAVARALTPVLAGASGMRHRTFTAYSIAGSVAWGAGVPLLGYLLGGIGFVRAHLDLVLLAVIAVSLVPVLLGVVGGRLRRDSTRPAQVDAENPPESVPAGMR
ncbi:DedA family protein [Mycobacterium sp. UM_WGJ]|uniref:DedA family protein n=1 Tax=Mycobacterium sp. UM_WGJ TaxID=1370120 RepID=UPI00041F35D5|nr:DedA family protein [Mycobacterium sp. UM_WGJ]